MSTVEPWKLPEEWEWSSIGKLTEQASGEWGEDPGVSAIDVPVVRSTDMRGRVVDPSAAAVRSMSASQLEKTRIRDGDVLVNKASGSARLVGRPSLVAGIGDDVLGFSNFVLRLRPDEGIDGRYLHAFLASNIGHRLFMRMNRTTSGLRNLVMTQYFRVPVPRPVTPEAQTRLLDALAAVERLEAAASRLAGLGQRLLIAELAHLIGGFGTEDLPEGWSWMPVKDLAVPIRGMTFKPEDLVSDDEPAAVQVLTTGSVQREVNWDEASWLRDEKVPTTKDLAVGDLIVSMSNSKALVGKVALLRSVPERRVSLGAFIYGLRVAPDSPVSAEMLHAWLASGPVQQQLRQRARQTTNLANLRPTVLNALRVPAPPSAAAEDLARVAQVGEQVRRQALALGGTATRLRDAVLAHHLGASSERPTT